MTDLLIGHVPSAMADLIGHALSVLTDGLIGHAPSVNQQAGSLAVIIALITCIHVMLTQANHTEL